MIVLPREQYKLFIGKLIDVPTFVHSILDNVVEGTVYTDSSNYNSLLFQTNSGLYFVFGDTSNESFLNELAAICQKTIETDNRFTLFSYSNDWNHLIEKYLDGMINKIERYSFTFDKSTYKNTQRNTIMEEYIVRNINANHIDNCLEFDHIYYQEYWDSPNNFLQNGVGFCIQDGDKVISECVSIFKSNHYAEVDITTDQNYRGKGLASRIAEQFIDYCLSKNIQPRWDCNIDNIASIQLGTKLGFKQSKKYAIYIKLTSN